jgi:tetratricopeptide (TPR) repeat protein/tRNA A-37 threonylcarbamoyl transferase component Bud32
MKHEDWLKVEELLNSALELEPLRRREFLDEVGASKPELRREVESLLGCEEKVDGFLAAPALAFSADFFEDHNGTDDRAGQTIGNYRIIREIGRGGMGAVFLAERADGEFQQEVALKIVRRSFDGSELARRFRRERQILASLNHPNIARLLDGGVSSDGEPFLAMEYVEGVRIDDFCDEIKLPIVRRLRLFLAVCQGVSYAHQNLIVHRDIKPSNVLVTTDSIPKLLDFGIAKLLDAEHAGEHTETIFRAFTPDYASPEQIRGEQITTASDVYSLGVLLDDLLHGARHASNQKPALGGWLSESSEQKTIATNLPTKQENGNEKVKPDNQKVLNAELKNIVRMARREEPERRYASVAQFAEDIQRYLDGLPVHAQKDSFTYRAGKFVRRNKAGVAAAALLLLTLIGGIIATAWQAQRATAQARIAAQERDRAERRFNDVRKLSNSLLFEITPKIERLEGSVEARETLVKRALEYLDSLAQEAGDDVQLKSELAAAYEKVGDLQGNPNKPNLSDFAGAIASYEKANAIRQKLPESDDNKRLLAKNFRELSVIRLNQFDVKGSLLDSAAALKIYESLTARNITSSELQTAYLEAQLDHAQTFASNQQFSEAITLYRQAIASLEKLDQHHQEIQRLLAKGYSLLGNALSWDGQQAEGEAETKKAVTMVENLAARFPADAIFQQGAWRVYMLASSTYENNNNEISLEFAQKALKAVGKAVELDPANTQAKENLAKTFSRIGWINVLLNKNSPVALSYLERAETILNELIDKEPQNVTYQGDMGILYTRFGDVREKQGDLQNALKAFQKSADLFERLSRADEKNTRSQRDLAQSLKSVGKVYVKLGETEKAEQNLRRALEILNRLKAQNALGDSDQILINEVQTALQKIYQEQ